MRKASLPFTARHFGRAIIMPNLVPPVRVVKDAEEYATHIDRIAARRAALEGNFQTHKAAGWTLNRFAAIDVAYVQAHDVAGSITPAEKACFLSHREVLRANLDRKAPLCVLEDDAAFGAKTCGVIDGLLRGGNAGLEWDILFTDVCVTQLNAMLDLVKMRRRLAAKNKVSLPQGSLSFSS